MASVLGKAWHVHENKFELELIDLSLSSYDEEEATCLIGIGLLCTQSSPMLRPSMSRVVAMLAGDVEVNEVTTKPGYLTEWQFKDISSSFLSDDFSTAATSGSDTSQESLSLTSSNVLGMPPSASPSQPLMSSIAEGR